jgi:hypothetical protein
MRIIPAIFASMSLMLLCSCATNNSFYPQLPTEVSVNKGAGLGDELFTTLRMEDGQELLFIVDTGAPRVLLDKSLEPKLGRPLGKKKLSSIYGKSFTTIYHAPKLYLGDTQLQTGNSVATSEDIQRISRGLCRAFHTNRQVMGVLGMACPKHYCLQIDFTAHKMRFLDPGHSNKQDWGKTFPIRANIHGCFLVPENLVEVKGPGSMIDTGYTDDGWLAPDLFRQWTNHTKPPVHGKARSPSGVFGGDDYPNLFLKGDGSEKRIGLPKNGIGLGFLSRHLVTFDFPNRTMYLKRTSVGPFDDKEAEAAEKFLAGLKDSGRLPGWTKIEKGRIYRFAYPVSETLDACKNGDSCIYHYKVVRASKESPWKLQRAWRTDKDDDRNSEDFPVP